MRKRHDIGGRSGHVPGEVVELAVVFVAAGSVHLLTSAAGHAAYGPALLMVVGLVVVVGTMAGRGLRARRREAGEPPRAWPRATPICVECGAAQETVVLRLDPTSADPTSADPTSADPTSADPTSADPTSADPTGSDTRDSPGAGGF